MLITIRQDSMKKSMAKQKNSSIFETAVKKANSPNIPSAKDVIGNIYPAGRDSTHSEKMYMHGEKKGYTPQTMKFYQDRIVNEQDDRTKAIINSPAKQIAPIDPRTGMPMQPQMTPQPNTVGMPGTMPMPAGMGHTLPEHGMQAGGRHMSPYMQKKKITIPGQSISESGHVYDNHKGGIKEGDLIRGEHIKYGPEGLPMDFDYKVKFEKDTVDQHGPYKIYKTTGIK